MSHTRHSPGDPALVSVCIPAHNAERHVGPAIESALSQTHPRIEVICVDDGSEDATPEILCRYASRIIAIRTDNRGAPAARNLALERATGEYVHFLDADNLLLPESIAHKLPPLERDEADLVFSNQMFLQDSGEIQRVGSRADPRDFDAFEYCLVHNAPAARTSVDTNVALHRRTMLRRVGGFREGVPRSQDKDLAFRLAAAGARFHYVDEELSLYRDHRGPRISQRPHEPDELIHFYQELVRTLEEGSEYAFSERRRGALCRHLIRLSKQMYRDGNCEAASSGFMLAEQLERGGAGDGESWPYRTARSLLGYSRTERLRAGGQRIRQRFLTNRQG